jgi:hypothetical protein
MFIRLPWEILTRGGTELPAFRVVRRPISSIATGSEVRVEVGDELPADFFLPGIRRARLRQFYEQQLIEPMDGALMNPGELEAAKRRERAHQHSSDVAANMGKRKSVPKPKFTAGAAAR